MGKEYESYVQARLLQQAFAARRNMFIPDDIDFFTRIDNGSKYITPAAMSIVLNCDMFGLMDAVKKHKIAIGELIYDGNYGSNNEEVHADDKVKLQGWINFLGLPCFADSEEARIAVTYLNEIN